MPHPSRSLDPGEEVLLEARPHWWCLAVPVVVAAAALAAALAAAVETTGRVVGVLAAALLVVALAWLVGRYARWAATSTVVTTRRVVHRRGVLARHRREVPLALVLDVGYHQTAAQRLLGAGDVVVEWAGPDGTEVLAWVARPAILQREVGRQADAVRRRQGVTVAGELERLDGLRRRGVLSDGEFAAEKARLLAR